MGRASHFKTIAYTDASPVFSRFLRRRDAWTNGDMHAIRRLPHQLFEGVSAGTFLHSNRLSSCCRRGKYPHSTEPVPHKRSQEERVAIPQRIVSLLPSSTEILCALGVEASLVGISHACDYPPGVTALPRLTAPSRHPSGEGRVPDRA